jgi:hypothetical protein
MAFSEFEHPLGQEVEGIHSALLSGMLAGEVEIPEHIKLNYEDPISGNGIGTLRIADWKTENITAVYFPVISDDETWKLEFHDDSIEPIQVKQRVFTRDILGRSFPVTIADTKIESSFLRIDIFDGGAVMFANDNGRLVPATARYESEAYDIVHQIARTQSSISALVDLASRY